MTDFNPTQSESGGCVHPTITHDGYCGQCGAELSPTMPERRFLVVEGDARPEAAPAVSYHDDGEVDYWRECYRDQLGLANRYRNALEEIVANASIYTEREVRIAKEALKV